MLRTIFLTLVATSLIEGQRNSQGRIKYTDANGNKVDRKLFAPYSQFKSNLVQFRHSDRPDSSSGETPLPVHRKDDAGSFERVSEPLYKPFAQVPSEVKRLLTESYDHQLPYVDRRAYLHPLPVPSRGQSSQEPRDYRGDTGSFASRGDFGSVIGHRLADVDVRGLPVASPAGTERMTFDASVPMEIRQLLKYQAEIPYNVIANGIIYRPEVPFIPEPIPVNDSEGYRYPSKVYYMTKDRGSIAKMFHSKPVKDKSQRE